MATVGSTRQWIKFNSIQLICILPTNNMQIEGGPAMLELFDFFSQQLILTTHHQNAYPTCKEVKRPPCDPL